MARKERQQAQGELVYDEVVSDKVTGPVEYALLSSARTPRADSPLLIWLHGGGGTRRFLEACRPQFLQAWAERALPAMVVATPTTGWSFYLDYHDGSERWESFLLEEFIPHLRRETGVTSGPLFIGGVSVGALGALRMAFKHPAVFAGVVALEPTVEESFSWDSVPSRDQVFMPLAIRKRLFGEPLDHQFWKANHPTAIAVANSPTIAASGLTIYLEAGDQDRLYVHHGVELLHRCLFDVGISHEYRLTKGANHVGPSIGPRILEGLRFLGRELWRSYSNESSIDSLVEIQDFERRVRQMENQSGFRRTETVTSGAVELSVHAQGEGRPVILLPSLGRSASDFANLADRLAGAGYRVLRPEPRGIVGSSRALAGITLNDLADDIAAVIKANGGEPASLVGHDYGATVARATATRHPDLVRNMVLLAAPGPGPTKPEPTTAHRRVFVPELSTEEHLEAIALAFFAEGNDPVVWVDGWHHTLAAAQTEAQQRTPTDEWSSGGHVDTLIVRPMEDQLISAESTRLLANELDGKVSVIEIPDAGHALLPEQPAAVAVAVLTWLRRYG